MKEPKRLVYVFKFFNSLTVDNTTIICKLNPFGRFALVVY